MNFDICHAVGIMALSPRGQELDTLSLECQVGPAGFSSVEELCADGS